MKTIIKSLFTLLVLFAFSCSQESTQDPEQDFIDPSSYEVEGSLTMEQFQAAEQEMSGKYRIYNTRSYVFDLATGANLFGYANLLRRSHGIFVNVRTTKLTPGHVYTLWWVIWNNPENCETPFACNDGDFARADMVKVEVMYAAGAVARWNGKATFLAYLKENDASGTINPLFLLPPYGGLHDSKKAEVHVVVRCHGPKIPGMVREQITTYGGGCEVYECVDIQASIFAPPKY
jgi:hypothetical protein